MRTSTVWLLLLVLHILCLPAAAASEWSDDASTVALYHFDDLRDSSGHGYDLELGGGAELTGENVSWMSEPGGKALKVMGLGDEAVVSIPDAVVMPGGSASPLTFEAWFYPVSYEAYSVSNYQILSFYQSWDCGLEVRDGKWNKPPVPTVRAGKVTIVSDDEWEESVALGEWHFLRITYDAGSVHVYVDSELIGSGDTAFNFGRTSEWMLVLGNFVGYIDEVRISNVVR